MSSDLSDRIEEAASEPQSASIDGDRAENRPIRDIIEADKYGRRLAAASRIAMPIRVFVFRPPGAV